MRNTIQRTAILNTVRSMHEHPTAEEVYAQVIKTYPAISKATVYRDLNQLAEVHEIKRVAIANAPDRYDFNVEEHAHCICRNCGKVFDYNVPLPNFHQSKDFQAEDISIVITGLCKDCIKALKSVN